MSEGNKAAREGTLGGWIALVATLLVLSYASIPGREAFPTLADRLMVAIRLNLVLALSILTLASSGHGMGIDFVGVAAGFYDE